MSPDSTIQRVCLTCGKTFSPRIADVKRGRGKYCSRDCSSYRPQWNKIVRSNDFEVIGDIARLFITDRQGAIIAETLVDCDRLPQIAKFRWALSSFGYAVCTKQIRGKNHHYFLHRVVMGLKHGDVRVIDHINRNKLDNRAVNLRVVTDTENNKNRSRPATSLYRGVCWDSLNRRWIAQTSKHGKKIWLGRFEHEIDAALAVMHWHEQHP